MPSSAPLPPPARPPKDTRSKKAPTRLPAVTKSSNAQPSSSSSSSSIPTTTTSLGGTVPKKRNSGGNSGASHGALSTVEMQAENQRQLHRDEMLIRSALESQEATLFSGIHDEMQDIRLATLTSSCRDIHTTSSKLLGTMELHTEKTDVINGKVTQTLMESRDVGALLRSFLDHEAGEEKRRLAQQELEIRVLTRDLTEAKLKIDRYEAEVQGLRESLSRKLLRTAVENDMLRQSVQREIEGNKLEIDGLKKDLGEKIDASVLAFQKPSYTSAVQNLQDLVAATQEKVQRQANELHLLIERIGANNSLAERIGDHNAKTSMHSCLPNLYRKQLAELSKDQILNMLDIVSFEDGVVESIGRALYAQHTPTHTQNVFV